MKKRILAFVCAAVMVMGMSLTAAAAGSITADDVKEDVAASAQEEAKKDAPAEATVSVTTDKVAVEVKGSTLKVEIPVSVAQREAAVETAQKILATKDTTIKINPIQASQIAAVAKIATQIATEAPKQATSGNVVSKVETKFVIDLSVDGGAAKEFTFDVKLGENEKAFAYHYNTTTRKVDIIACTKSDAGVSFKLDSYSPVALVVVTEAAAPAAQTPATTTETPAVTATESPKTGDVVTLFAMVSTVAGAGALALKKREN